jgi:hypothetical protein
MVYLLIQRIQFISVNGKEIVRERIYRAAFITEQGVPLKFRIGQERHRNSCNSGHERFSDRQIFSQPGNK